MLKIEDPDNSTTKYNIFLGPSDGSSFKQINPTIHGLRADTLGIIGDLDYSGTRAIFAMNGGVIPNEKLINWLQLFAYDDTIGDTLVGSNVLVNIDTDAWITFSSVSTPGNTGSLISQAGLLPDTGANFGNPDLHYEYWTDAAFSGNVEVCFDYGSRFTNDMVKVLKRSGDSWINITSSINKTTNTVCGTTTSLGEFVAVYDPKFFIPTLSQTGLIILAVLLFAAIILMHNRFQARGGIS